MKAFDKLVEDIETKMFEVGTDNIDYSVEKNDRFYYDCSAYVESKNNIIWFEFNAFDCGDGFQINDIRFDIDYLPNIIEKLNNTTFKYEK